MVKKGFTLLEILIVMALLAVLAGLAGFTHKNRVRKAQETVLRNNLNMIRTTLDAYHHDKGHFPPDLESLAAEGYLREIPLDPITKSRESWFLVYEELSGNEDSSYEAGLFDVRSGSQLEALDGTLYSEW